MNPDSPKEKPASVLERHPLSHSHENKTRRVIDTGSVILFHAATLGLVAWSAPKATMIMLALGVAVLVMDVTYYFSPPKQKAKHDPVPEAESPDPAASVSSFALELFVLLAPPLAFIIWLLFLVWQHETLTRNELLVIVIVMPAVVGLVTWIIKYRLTHFHLGVKNQTTRFVAGSMLGTWIGSTFFFIVFLVGLLVKLFLP